MPEPPTKPHPVVFLHGWCGRADEVDSIRAALPGPVLPISWMPAGGDFDLEHWPTEPDPDTGKTLAREFADGILDRVRTTIIDAGFVGATVIGHSLGGAMACVLAKDPDLAIRQVVLLDGSAPVLPEKRRDYLERMLPWVDRAASGGRLLAQAGWIAEASSWIPDFFSLEDQGDIRLHIERRFLFAPVVEAALAIAGAVQWPITESLESMECAVHGLAGDPGRMPVEALLACRPDAKVEQIKGTGHYPHRFQAERTRAWLEAGPLSTASI
ncbi:MAG: alpha/beta hydrolase [Phycisphaera sp.]|nr:alpha/beta hydrolase [Phycisphaera sp.]